jgi:hypothetical protein
MFFSSPSHLNVDNSEKPTEKQWPCYSSALKSRYVRFNRSNYWLWYNVTQQTYHTNWHCSDPWQTLWQCHPCNLHMEWYLFKIKLVTSHCPNADVILSSLSHINLLGKQSIWHWVCNICELTDTGGFDIHWPLTEWKVSMHFQFSQSVHIYRGSSTAIVDNNPKMCLL